MKGNVSDASKCPYCDEDLEPVHLSTYYGDFFVWWCDCSYWDGFGDGESSDFDAERTIRKARG